MTDRLNELFDGMPARLSVDEVAQILGMTKKGVYKWLNEGVIPGYKIGGSWIVLRDELRDTLAAGRNTPAPPPPD